MASNNQKCVWVYAIGYELVHFFQTAEEADVWWASYKVEVGDDVEGAIEQVFQKLPPSPTTTPDETVEFDGDKIDGALTERNQEWSFDEPTHTKDFQTIHIFTSPMCWEIDCLICGELQGKDDCPFETGYADDEFVCDKCWMCCEECSKNKNPAVGARYGDVCECEDEEEQVLGPEHDICCKCGKFEDTGNVCDCGGSHRELCDECKEEK